MTREEVKKYYGATKTRYAVTHINKDGERVMSHANQGRNHYDTPEDCQSWIEAARRNNSADSLKSVYGDASKIEVRAIECYALAKGEPGDAVCLALFPIQEGSK